MLNLLWEKQSSWDIFTIEKMLTFKAVSKLSFTLIINSIYWNSPCDHFQAFIIANWTKHSPMVASKREANLITNHLFQKLHSAWCLWCFISWQHMNRCSLWSLCRSGRQAYKRLGRRAVIMKVWENRSFKTFPVSKSEMGRIKCICLWTCKPWKQ